MKTLTLITTFFLICLQTVAQDFWIPLELPNPDAEIYCMKSYGEQGLLIGTQFGLYKTLDNGETWILTGFEGLAAKIDINYLNGDIFLGNRDGLFYSNDSGNTWNSSAYQDQGGVRSMILSQENNIFIGNHLAQIVKINYTGTEVEVVFDDNNSGPITSFTQSSEGVLFAGAINYFGYDSGVYRSFDEGDTWEHCWQVQNFVDALDVDSLGNIYAGCGGGGIGLYKSSDLGTTWQNIKYGVGILSIAITPNNDIYIGCSREFGTVGGVYRSMDNGVTWEWIVAGLTNFYVEKLSITKDGYLFAGAWNKFGNPLFRTISPVVTNIESLEKDKQLLVFPNPVNNILTFNTCLPLEGKTAQVKIYNIAGKKVLEKEIQLTSNNSLDISYLKTGTYIFHLQLNNQVFTKKILKT